MPELPEVHKVSQVLKKRLINKTIIKYEIFYDKIIENSIECILNKKIKDIFRIGKYIVFEFDEYYLLSHMRMEGRFYVGSDLEMNHVYLKLYLNDSNILYYQDFRKFGRFKVVEKNCDLYGFLKLGNDAMDVDYVYLKRIFSRSNKCLKNILMDQKLISGIGNIYADEICFESKVHPLSKVKNIKNVKRVVDSIKNVLNKNIKLGINSIDNSEYISWEFDMDLNVHFKDECKICKSKIKKIKINQRTTYYCERCQKLW